MSTSQRVADDREHRRGLVLGLTLAEMLLLLLFLLMLALSWRMSILQRETELEREKARNSAVQLSRLEATLGSLAPLLAELQKKGSLDLTTVQDLAARMARADGLADENAKLKQANAELTSILGNMKLLGSDIKKLKAIDDALAAAAKISPNDPPELLTRAVEILKRLGADTQPDQVRALSELLTQAEKLRALEKAIASATVINPNDPVEAIERAVDLLNRVGPDTKPDQIPSKEQLAGLQGQLDRVRRERDNLMKGAGKGLTLPSCWITADGQTEYIYDITIQDDGVVVRDATPARANDPDMRLAGSFQRNSVIHENLFRKQTTELFRHSQKLNCRYYAVVRDQTGEFKARYKALVKLVEGHFYKLERGDPWGPAAPLVPSPVPVGGELVQPPLNLRR